MKDCQYVIHMASPFPALNPHDESEIIEPAVEGTINVLEACSKAKIKRVVLTSSIAAVHGCKDVITLNCHCLKNSFHIHYIADIYPVFIHPFIHPLFHP